MFKNIHMINLSVMTILIVTDHLFARFLLKKERYLLRFLFSTLGCLIFAFLFPVPDMLEESLISYGVFLYLCLFLCSFAAVHLCYQGNWWAILFCCIAGYTIQHLTSAFDDIFSYTGFYLFLPLPRIVTYLCMVILVCFICYTVLSKDIKKYGQIYVNSHKMLILTGASLFVDIIFGLFVMKLSWDNFQTDYLIIISLYNAMACLFLLWLLFALLSNKQLELEVKVMSSLMDEEKKQFKLTKDNIELINLKCHDLKYQIRKLRRKDGEIDRAALKEIEDAVGIYDSVTRTGNNALDIILTEKSLVCEKENINLTCMAEGIKMSFLSAPDIYSLFGNIVDNAIEAVRQLPDINDRNIILTVQAKGKLLSIHQENYFNSQLVFENGLPHTTKTDKRFHGYGMKSMRMIVEKYDGSLTTSAKENIFHLNIIIPIPGKQDSSAAAF